MKADADRLRLRTKLYWFSVKMTARLDVNATPGGRMSPIAPGIVPECSGASRVKRAALAGFAALDAPCALCSGGAAPDPEVTDKPKRRRFTVEYKLSLLKKADAYRYQPGKVGALLRREGVYSSTLSQWRRQREEGTLSALKPKRRGRKIQEVNPLAGRVTELEREVQQLQGKLRQAETIIDVQKKLCELV